MTTGEKLKKYLGLTKFKICRIQRSLNTISPVYFVYVNSKRPDFPITNAFVNRRPNIQALYSGSSLPNEIRVTPLLNIEDYDGILQGKIFIKIDLAYSYFLNDKMYENKFKEEKIGVEFYDPDHLKVLYKGQSLSIARFLVMQSEDEDILKILAILENEMKKHNYQKGLIDFIQDHFSGHIMTPDIVFDDKTIKISGYGRCLKLITPNNHSIKFDREEYKENIIYFLPKLEEITLFDLRDKDIISDTTNKYKKIRQKYNKGANINTKLISCEINDKDILFKFLTEATDDPNDITPKKEINPNGFTFKENPSRTYEIWMKFPDAIDLIDWSGKTTLNQNDLNNLLQSSDVQLWSNSPSWQYQGFNFWNTQLNSAIFPTSIAPVRWNKTHGDGQAFLDKHTAQLIAQIKFFLNQMAAMLEKQLKIKGIIK